MADERVIKTTIELDGEKAFKSAIQSVNSEMRVLDSELKLVTAQFGKSDQGMKGLQATADILTKKVDEQKAKINMLKTAVEDSGKAYDKAKDKYSAAQKKLEDMTAKFGENSDQARRAQAELDSAAKAVDDAGKSYNGYRTQLNNTQAALIKTTDELKKTSAAAKDLKNLQLKDLMPEKVAKEVEKVAKAFGKVATEAGKAAAAAAKIGAQTVQKSFEVSKKALEAYAGAAIAAGTAIVKLTGDAALFADDLNTLSKQTGISTEELQKMQYAAALIDVDVDTITGSMAKLTKNMTSSSDAVTGAFEALGVSVRDELTGELRNNQDVFNDVINALGTIENETERDSYAMAIFGKSAQDLNPLILGGADALRELGDQAEEAGLILSQDALDSLNAYNDSLDVMKANAAAAANVIATNFAPRLQVITDKLGSNLPSLASSFGKMFSGDITAGASFRTQIGRLTEEITSEINDMLPDLLYGLNTVILTVADNVPKAILTLLPTVISGLKDLALGVVDEIPTLAPMLVQGGIDLFTGLIGGLNEVIKKLTPMLPGIVKDIGKTIIDNAPLILETGFDLLINLVEGLTDALPELISVALELVPIIVDKLVEKLPELIDAGVDLIFKLADALLSEEGLAKLAESVVKIGNAIVDKFKETDWLKVGEEVFALLGQGLENIFSASLGIIDGLLGTNLKQWYDDITEFWYDAGGKLYSLVNAEQIASTEASIKASELQRDIILASNKYMTEGGLDAAESLRRAKQDIVDTAEEIALFNEYLSNVLTDAEALERYNSLVASGQIETGAAMTASKYNNIPSNAGTTTINNYTYNQEFSEPQSPWQQRQTQQQTAAMTRLYN